MHEIDIRNVQFNPFTEFSQNWMVLTVGNGRDCCNAMTIAWGHLGALWKRSSGHSGLPTAICYVRPSRYTSELLNREERFTISCFDAAYKKALGYLGSHSGRDGDKFCAAGLTPAFGEGTAWPAEATTILVCRKLYHAPLLESGFDDKSLIDLNYAKGDIHIMYVGEVLKVLTSE